MNPQANARPMPPNAGRQTQGTSSSSRPTAQKSKPAKSKKLLKTGVLTIALLTILEWTSWIAVGLVAAALLSVSVVPWISAAEIMVSPDTPLFFFRPFFQIPVVGAWLSGSLSEPIKVVGTLLMVAFNGIQLVFVLTQANQLNMPQKWANRIMIFSGIGWLVELFVAAIAYPPYAGGLAAFAADFPLIYPPYILPGQILAIVILLANFELFIWGAITMVYVVRALIKKQKAKLAATRSA